MIGHHLVVAARADTISVGTDLHRAADCLGDDDKEVAVEVYHRLVAQLR